jgi:hypothetical protein
MTIQHAHLEWDPGNLLASDAASFEAGLGGWGTFVSMTCVSDSPTGTPAFIGTKQMVITSTAGGVITSQTAAGTSGYPVVVDELLNAVAHIRTTASARDARIDFLFYDGNGTLLTTIDGANVTEATDRWKRTVNLAATVPADAAYAALRYRIAAVGGASEVHHLDGVMFWVGAPLASRFLHYPGESSSTKLTCPDSTQLSPVTDIDLRVKVGLDTWAQAGGSFIAKWITSGNQRSFRFFLGGDGKLNLSWSADGTAVLTRTSTVAVNFVDGATGWVRAMLDPDDGGGNHVVTFFTSPDGSAWTQLGTVVTTAGATGVYNSTAQVELGSHDDASSRMTDLNLYSAQLLSLLTERADWDFNDHPIADTTVTDSLGNVLTIAGNAYLDEWEEGLGDTFGAYVVERSDDTGTTWRPIRIIPSMHVFEADDYEGLRNVTSLYRVNIERADGVYGEYSNTDDAHPIYAQCGYQFTSNEDPTVNQEWLDEPDRSYRFPERSQELELFGRDNVVIFKELEDRGDEFTASLWLYMGGTPSTNNVPDAVRGRQAFQPLLDLVRANLSYVCVLDQDSNRWFAALRSGDRATRIMPGEKYTYPILIREVTDLPSTPTTLPAGFVPLPTPPTLAVYDVAVYDGDVYV